MMPPVSKVFSGPGLRPWHPAHVARVALWI